MKTSTLRQIIKEEIAQSSASELLSMLAHPDFKKQLSILNNDSVNNAYENLYATLMGIERNESLNENKSRTVIINSTEEWEDLANNLKGYKYSGSLKPVDVNRGLIQLSNYAKYPYEVIIDDKNKMIQFGKHSLKEASYKTSKNSKQAQQLKKGDIITSGDEVISVSSGVRTPSGKVEVTLKNKKGITRTSTWGKTTMIGVKQVTN